MSRPDEIWLPVVGYDGYYEVSNLGNVRSVDREVSGRNWKCPQGYKWIKKGSMLKKLNKRNGYDQVNLYKDGSMKSVNVHRLVMNAFIGPSELVVNHKNEIKTDNRLSNLEYVTTSQNIRYSTARAVESYDLSTGETIKVYQAGIDVAKDGYDVAAVNHCCLGTPRYLSHHGVGWRFANVKATS